jgi:hypothetical protein
MSIASLELDTVSYADLPLREVGQAAYDDWDRTIGNVAACMRRLYRVVDPYGITEEGIEQEKKLVEGAADGGSFEPLTAIANQIRARHLPVTLDQIEQDFLNYDDLHPEDSLVYDDGVDLLWRQHEAGMPYTVLTYGVSDSWQRLKIQSSGYEGHIETLPHSHKDQFAARALSPDGTYDSVAFRDGVPIARYKAHSLVIVEDKPGALAQMPDKSTGIIVSRPGENKTKSQQGEWPRELTVASLAQIAIINGMTGVLKEPQRLKSTKFPQNAVQYIPVLHRS